MPVLVTSAHQSLARRIAGSLLDDGAQVRLHTPGDVSSLRAAGAYVATGTPDDEGHLEAALTNVHTVVHVGRGADADPALIVRDAQVLANAATGAAVERIIMLSLPGAAANADDPLRRAKAAAEAALATVPCPLIVLRVGLVATAWLRDMVATAGLPADVLDTEVAPVGLADVAELVAAFDRARAASPDGKLIVAADGPQRLPLSRYLDAAGVATVGSGSLVGRQVADAAVASRLVSMLRGRWDAADEPGVLDGWKFTGVMPSTVS